MQLRRFKHIYYIPQLLKIYAMNKLHDYFPWKYKECSVEQKLQNITNGF